METNQKPDRTFKRYDEAFKRSAVELLLSSGKSLKQIATELGITTWTLRDWKKRFGPPPSSALSADELQAENQRLRQELLRIKTQRDILKKTLGILSTPNDNDSNA
jgi:transposase-like protein